jgi:hypothetical protein
MSSINIQVIDVSIVEKASATGNTYNAMNVAYTNLDSGKVESKSLFAFSAPKDVWSTLETAGKGTIFSVDREKDKKQGKYWEWVGIHRQDAPPPRKEGTTPTRPAYETPEERAGRQVSIVRQSCLKSAVELMREHTSDPSIVINISKQFEAYVNGTSVADITDDIPY